MNTSGSWVLETPEMQKPHQEGWVLETPENQHAPQVEESMLSKAARYPMQVAKMAPYLSAPVAAIDAISSIEAGSAVKSTLDDLEDLYTRGLLKEDEYNNAVQKVSSQKPEQFAPTLNSLYTLIENKTGLPLEAKTNLQKFIEFGSMAGALKPGSAIQKATAAVSVPLAREGLIQAGTPEPVANLLSFLAADPIEMTKLLKTAATKSSVPVAGQLSELIQAVEDYVPKQPQAPAAIESVSKISAKPISEISEKASESTKSLGAQEMATKSAESQRLIAEAEQRAQADIASELQKTRSLPPEEIRAELPQTRSLPPEEIRAELPQTRSLPPEEIRAELQKTRSLPPEESGAVIDIDREPVHRRVSKIFTENDMSNSTIGGQVLKKEVADIADQQYTLVNQAYAEAKSAMKAPIEDDQLLRDWAKKYEKTLGPKNLDSPAEKALRKWLKDIQKRKFKTNQEKINLEQKINSFVDYTMPHGSDPKKIFNPLKKALSESIERTSDKESLSTWRAAKQKHAKWQNDFANPTIENIRNLENREYKGIFESVQDHDSFSAVQNVYSLDPRKAGNLQILKKNFVRKQLDSYIKNPSKSSEIAFHEAVNELSPYLTADEMSALRNTFSEEREAITRGQEAIARRNEAIARNAEIERANAARQKAERREAIARNAEIERARAARKKAERREAIARNAEIQKKIAARKKALDAEKREIAERFSKQDQVVLESKEIESRMKRVDSAKELKKVIEKAPNGGELYDELVRREASDKLFGNNPPDSKMLDKGLKDIETRRWISELMGEEELKALDKLSEEWSNFDKFIDKYGDPKKYPGIYDALRESDYALVKSVSKYISKNLLHPQRIRNTLERVRKPLESMAKKKPSS